MDEFDLMHEKRIVYDTCTSCGNTQFVAISMNRTCLSCSIKMETEDNA